MLRYCQPVLVPESVYISIYTSVNDVYYTLERNVKPTLSEQLETNVVFFFPFCDLRSTSLITSLFHQHLGKAIPVSLCF